VLLVPWERDGLPVKDLGERLGLDSGTLTRCSSASCTRAWCPATPASSPYACDPLLKRLVHQGLVDRRGADDERVVGIHLTTAGRAMRARARRIPIELA
jgi:MarR family transcriptional regulator, organic hydroperoxide resistance regulator